VNGEMKFPTKKLHVTLVLAVVLALSLFSAATGVLFVNLGKANPIGEWKWATPPIISIHSPVNNETFCVSDVLLSFNVTKPTDWLIHGGHNAKQMLLSVGFQLDGKYYDRIPVNSDLKSPFEYSTNLANLGEGVHSLQIYAYATGWIIEMHGLWEYDTPINSSSNMVYFTVDVTPPAISILSVESKTYDSPDIPLTFTVNEAVYQTSYSLDRQANVTITGNTTLAGLSDGSHSLIVYAKDLAGNVGASETIYFSVKTQQQGFLGSTLPMEYGYAIVSVVAIAAAVAMAGHFFLKRKNRGEGK
jgi:hypothetical protein